MFVCLHLSEETIVYFSLFSFTIAKSLAKETFWKLHVL